MRNLKGQFKKGVIPQNILKTSDFIIKAKKIHGDKYDYDNANYINYKTSISITCKQHGDFPQIPHNHLKGSGCPKCAGNYRYKGNEFFEKLNEIYNKKYDFSDSEYVNSYTKIIVKCDKHGEFYQWPTHLLAGISCRECGFELFADQRRKSLEEFISEAQDVHGDKYDYSLVDYKHCHTPVSIICEKHGEFLQSPTVHTLQKSGCPHCNESKGEKLVNSILEKNIIKSIRQKKFEDCNNRIEGRYCIKLPFDFYLPDKNTCIEYDGVQHFKPISQFGGEQGFLKIQKNDKIKNHYCEDNGIKLIRIPYTMKKQDIEPYILSELGM
jgi:hypothetical protein